MLPDLEYINLAEMKAKLSEKVKWSGEKGRRFAITSHGRPKAVLLSYSDYLGLVGSKDAATPKTISFDEWNAGRGERQKVIDSVSSLFDAKKLSRKGQKGYKKNEVIKK